MKTAADPGGGRAGCLRARDGSYLQAESSKLRAAPDQAPA